MRLRFGGLVSLLVFAHGGAALLLTVQPEVTRDSAGIMVVEHRGHDKPTTAFRIAPDPMLDVGGMSRGSQHELRGVTAAFSLADGRLVVANSRPPELRVFGALGRPLALIGEKGQQPGELASESFRVTRRGGDSLLAFDPVLNALILYTGQGTFVKSWSTSDWKLKDSVRGHELIEAGTFRDGSILFRQSLADSRTGFVRDSIRLFRVSREGQLLAAFGDFVGGGMRTLIPLRTPRGTATTQGTYAVVANEAVSRNDYLAVDGDRLLFMDDARNEIRIFSGGGTLVRLVKLQGVPLFSRPAIDRRDGEQRVQLGFLVDDAGRIWVEDYRRPQDAVHRWTVLDRNGNLLGSALMPRRLQVTSIGPDKVVGVRRDRNDYERVQVFRMTRTRRAA